jgi:hypothetical protein
MWTGLKHIRMRLINMAINPLFHKIWGFLLQLNNVKLCIKLFSGSLVQ